MKGQAWIKSLETMPQIWFSEVRLKIILLTESRELRTGSVLFYL